jgi:hypothetical protein
MDLLTLFEQARHHPTITAQRSTSGTVSGLP